MKCAKCQTENAPERRYCCTCGRLLSVICEACGFANTAEARFCGGCGQAVRAAGHTDMSAFQPHHFASGQHSIQGERKQVTVLFADLCGSLELIEGSDPELARMILDGAVQIMMTAVHRHEGTVNRIMGDGIMALFGAPLAQEGHAVRACYAALAITESIRAWSDDQPLRDGVALQVRVGINSGEVVVRALQSDLALHYDVVGTAAHLASRMEQLASPGTIRLTDNTARLVTGFVEFKSLGLLPVKGLKEAIEVYELEGRTASRTPFQANLARGLSRFVGRSAELQILSHALQQAKSGFGQIVAIVGEPGIGKSRLCFEFLGLPATEGWRVLRTAAVSYGRATPWLPVADLLRDCFAIEPQDDGAAIADKVRARLKGLDDRLEGLAAPLLACLERPVDDASWQGLAPAQRRQQMLDAVKGLLIAESRVQPLALLFEDLHGCDHESQALLDTLVGGMRTARLLLIVTYRPDHRHGWGSKRYYMECPLDPLHTSTALELLSALLGNDPDLDPLKAQLIERTSGNPFFLEESVRELAERGVLRGSQSDYRLAGTPVVQQTPATVQATLAARIDRLLAADKDLLLVAAVIGRRVDVELLQAVAGRPEEELRSGLLRLSEPEFLDQVSQYPNAEYVFHHALTQEVAYGNVLHERRRALNRRIVDALEARGGNEQAGWHERLARHALRGELWEKAGQHYRVLGDLALERSANAEAVSAYREALAALGHLSHEPAQTAQTIEVRLALANALFGFGQSDQVLDCVREAETLAERSNDRRGLARASSAMALYHWMMGDPVSAINAGRRAQKIAEELDDFDLRVLATLRLAVALQAHGDYQETVGLFGWAIGALAGDQIRKQFGLTSIAAVAARSSLARSLAELGRFAEGEQVGEEGVRLASDLVHPFSQVYAAREVGLFYMRKGDFERAIELLEDGVCRCEATSNQVLFPVSAAGLGYSLVLAGRLDDGLRWLETAAERALSMDLMVRLSLQLSWLGEAYLLAGRPADALAQGTRALELARRYDERGHLGWALRLLGEVHRLSASDALAAENYYNEALSLAETLQMRVLEAHCRLGLGLLHQASDRKEEARQALRSSFRLYEQMGASTWLHRAKAAAGGID